MDGRGDIFEVEWNFQMSSSTIRVHHKAQGYIDYENIVQGVQKFCTKTIILAWPHFYHNLFNMPLHSSKMCDFAYYMNMNSE